MMKINVDVALLASENRGVVAAICRSAIGTYMGSSVLACQGISGPATLEALAWREALAFVANLAGSEISLLLQTVLKLSKLLTTSVVPATTLLFWKPITIERTSTKFDSFMKERRQTIMLII